MMERPMLKKYLATAMLGSALLAPLAYAAETTATPGATAATTNSSYQGDWRASKLVGLNVYNNNNESIGSINDLLTDKSGSIKAVVIGVGGFLGVGEHLVAIPFDQVKFVNEPVASTVSSSSNANKSTTTGASSTNTAPSTAATSKPNPWYP